MAEKTTAKTASTAALAYLGDCIVEKCARTFLVEAGLSSSAHLNRAALRFVKADAQAEASLKISDMLSEDEAIAFRRGRNIGHTNTPKSATVAQYRAATGLEALFGYLSLEGRHERIDELFRIAYADKIEEVEKEMEK